MLFRCHPKNEASNGVQVSTHEAITPTEEDSQSMLTIPQKIQKGIAVRCDLRLFHIHLALHPFWPSLHDASLQQFSGVFLVILHQECCNEPTSSGTGCCQENTPHLKFTKRVYTKHTQRFHLGKLLLQFRVPLHGCMKKERAFCGTNPAPKM